MGTWSKIVLSGSTAGQGISVTGTSASQGTVVHTAPAANGLDEVILYAHSTVTTAAVISFMVGPTTALGSRYTHTLPADDLAGLQPVMPGLVLTATTVVKAFVSSVDAVRIFGWANRYAT